MIRKMGSLEKQNSEDDIPPPIEKDNKYLSLTSSVPADSAIAPGNNDHSDPKLDERFRYICTGDYLYKCSGTSFTGRNGHSQVRKRRFFWVNPYTGRLYWTTRKLSPGWNERKVVKVRSVYVEYIIVEYDEDTIPSGLFQNSFTFVASQGWRSVKVTAENEEKHFKWLNALKILFTVMGHQNNAPHLTKWERFRSCFNVFKRVRRESDENTKA